MSATPLYRQFIFGKLKGAVGQEFQLIASSAHIDKEVALDIHKGFAHLQPSAAQLPYLNYRYVLRAQKDSAVLAHFYLSSVKEPGRNNYLLSHYQSLSGSDLRFDWPYFELLASSIQPLEPIQYEELPSVVPLGGTFPISVNSEDYRIFRRIGSCCHSLWKALPPKICTVNTPVNYSLRHMLRDVYLVLSFARPESDTIWFVLTDAQSLRRDVTQAATFVFEPTGQIYESSISPAACQTSADAFMTVISTAIASDPSKLPSMLTNSRESTCLVKDSLEILARLGQVENLRGQLYILWRNAIETKNWPLSEVLADIHPEDSVVTSIPSKLWLDVTNSVFESHARLLSRFLELSAREFKDPQIRTNLFAYLSGLSQCSSETYPALLRLCQDFRCDRLDAAVIILFETLKAICPSITFKTFSEIAQKRSNERFISLLLTECNEYSIASELLNWCRNREDLELLCFKAQNCFSGEVSDCIEALLSDSMHLTSALNSLIDLMKGPALASGLFCQLIHVALRLRHLSAVLILVEVLSNRRTVEISETSVSAFVDWICSDPNVLLSRLPLDGALLGSCFRLIITCNRQNDAARLFVCFLQRPEMRISLLVDTLGEIRRDPSPLFLNNFVLSILNESERKNLSSFELASLCKAVRLTSKDAHGIMGRRLIYYVVYQRGTWLSLAETLEILIAGANSDSKLLVLSEISSLSTDWNCLASELASLSTSDTDHQLFNWSLQELQRVGFVAQSEVEIYSRWVTTFEFTLKELRKKASDRGDTRNEEESKAPPFYHRFLRKWRS